MGLRFNTETFCIPSFGMAFGLPYRFETGIRWYPFYTLEGSLRWQINPRLFKLFDSSINFHYGNTKLKYFPYSKIGITIGKYLKGFQPFLSFYKYYYDEYYYGKDDKFASTDVITFGVGIPYKNDIIIPEINYHLSSDIAKGTMFLSIGIRASIQRKK